jgi:hypothetical protein
MAEHADRLRAVAKPSRAAFGWPYGCLSLAMCCPHDQMAACCSGSTQPCCFGGVPYLFPPCSGARLTTATLLAPTEAEAPPLAGQAWAKDTLTVVQLRPSDEEIAKAFRQATEDWQPLEVQEAALETDEPAIAGPIPLPKKRPPARP